MEKLVKGKLKEARKYYQDGQYEECLSSLIDVFSEDPHNYNAIVLRAACHNQLGMEDKSVDGLFEAIKMNETNLLGWQGLLQTCGKNCDRFYSTLVFTALKLMNYYSASQFPEKRFNCIQLLVELLTRYRLELPTPNFDFRDACCLVLDKEPKNQFALESLIRLKIEEFLVNGFPVIISPSLRKPREDALPPSSFCDDLCHPNTTAQLETLSDLIQAGDGQDSWSVTLTVRLGRLAVSVANSFMKSMNAERAADSSSRSETGTASVWSILLNDLERIELNGCSGLENWHRRGYMDLHACCLHALVAYKAYAFDRCDRVLMEVLSYCKERVTEAAKEIHDLTVFPTTKLSQLTGFLTSRPVCTPFRLDLTRLARTLSPYFVIEEWCTALRLANNAASALPHVAIKQVAELVSASYPTDMDIPSWASTMQALRMECCLAANRADLALNIGLGMSSKSVVDLDELSSILLTSQDSEPRFRVCLCLAVADFLLARKNEDTGAILEELTASASKLAPEIRLFSSARDFYLYGQLLSQIVLLQSKCVDDIGTELTQLDALLAGVKADPLYYANFVCAGQIYRRKGSVSDAMKVLTVAHNLMPSSPECAYHLALTLCQKGELLKALDVYAPIDQKHFTKEMWLNYGLINLYLGRSLQCVPALQRVIILDPKNILYWEILGEAYLLRRSYETAIKTLKRAIQLDPTRPLAYVLCGQAYRRFGEDSFANQYLLQGLERSRQKYSDSADSSYETYIMNLKELTELNLSLSYLHLSQGLSGCAIKELELVLEYLAEAIDVKLKYGPLPVWIYHYAGSAFSLLSVINDPELRLIVPSRLLAVLPDAKTYDLDDREHNTKAIDIGTSLKLGGIYFSCALKRFAATLKDSKTVNCQRIVESPTIVNGCLLISFGFHCLAHGLFLRREFGGTQTSSDELDMDTLFYSAEYSLKQALELLNEAASADQRFLDEFVSEGDLAEVTKISQLEMSDEQIVQQRLDVNCCLRAKSWYGLAALYSAVNNGFDSEIDYCLCQSLLMRPNITEAGASLAVRLLHQGRMQFSSSLLTHFQASDSENFIVWLAAAHLHIITEAPEAQPPDAQLKCPGNVNYPVLQDLLQSACLGASVQVANQLIAHLFPLLVEVMRSNRINAMEKHASRLQDTRDFLHLAIEVAAEAQNRALAFEPRNFRLWHNRGLLLQLAGLSTPATHCFRRSLDLFSSLQWDSSPGLHLDHQLLVSHYFLSSYISGKPDWSIGSQLLNPSEDYDPTICASFAEAYAKALMFLHCQSSQPQIELARKCLVDEVSRLAYQGIPDASSLITSLSNAGEWILLFHLLRITDCNQLSTDLQRYLFDLLSHKRPKPDFQPDLAYRLSLIGDQLAKHPAPDTNVLNALKSYCLRQERAYETLVDDEDDMSSGHWIYDHGRLGQLNWSKWVACNSTLSDWSSNSCSTGLSHFSRFVALQPDNPIRWATLAEWLLDQYDSTQCNRRIRLLTKSQQKKLEKRATMAWSIVFHCVRNSLELTTEVPMSMPLVRVLYQCADHFVHSGAELSQSTSLALIKGLRRAAAMYPHVPGLLTQLETTSKLLSADTADAVTSSNRQIVS
ncbi:unnamed protein product [Calicophoron daubneyi]|uniref:Tetratricopeptide repeat protein 37 n=1 Tax=Calicophoron daubneyi TaxID=300641 RepID=A0AAV2THL2_CALDB